MGVRIKYDSILFLYYAAHPVFNFIKLSLRSFGTPGFGETFAGVYNPCICHYAFFQL